MKFNISVKLYLMYACVVCSLKFVVNQFVFSKIHLNNVLIIIIL